MSVDYAAWTVIGVRLNENQLVRYRKVRGCNCFDVSSNFNFCPTCGKEAHKSHKHYVAPFNDDCDELRTEWGNGLTLVRPHYECGHFFFGHVLGVARDVGVVDFSCDFVHWPDQDFIQRVKQDLIKILNPLEIWDEKGFGIYTFLGVSWFCGERKS